MTTSVEPETSWARELHYLVASFPRGTRAQLGLYAALQFGVSLLDLAGLAVVLPVMCFPGRASRPDTSGSSIAIWATLSGAHLS